MARNYHLLWRLAGGNGFNQSCFYRGNDGGDIKGRLFIPIPTYNIAATSLGSPQHKPLFEMTAKYVPCYRTLSTPSYNPHGALNVLSVATDRESSKRGNGLVGSAEQTGSVGVVTINCARLGYKFRDDKARLFEELDRLLDLARQSLEMKRCVISERMKAGLYPFTERYLGTLRNHFSTIGVNGINECIRNFTADRQDISTPEGIEFGLQLLDHVRARIVTFQQETGHLYNLEATPAEGTTYRFAREDRKRFPAILQAGTDDAPYYTNSSQLPVGKTDDPFTAMVHQEAFQRRYTGGTVFHLYMGERISSALACKELVRRTLTRLISISPSTFSICPNTATSSESISSAQMRRDCWSKVGIPPRGNEKF